jgi:hypothetical protein
MREREQRVRQALSPETLLIVESDNDAELLRTKTCRRVEAFPTVAAAKRIDTSRMEGVRRVVVIAADTPQGRKFVGYVKRALARLERSGWRGKAAFALLPPGEGGLIEHYSTEPSTFSRRMKDLVRSRKELRAFRETGVLASEVTPERVEYLIQELIPRAKLTVVEGPPGVGKSLVLGADFAARVTTGRPLPDGTPVVEGGAVVVSMEDGLGDTIRPRLEAACANLDRCVLLTRVRVNEKRKVNGETVVQEVERPFQLPRDLATLREAVLQVGAKLVVLDPLAAILDPGYSMNSDQDVRQVLLLLARLAEETGAAVVVVRHWNKGEGLSALNRGTGSVGIGAAARAVLLVARHPSKEEGVSVLAGVKGNLSAAPRSRSFRIVSHPSGTAVIEWLGFVDLTADDLVAPPPRGGRRPAVDTAKLFLIEELRAGRRPSKEVSEKATRLGISEKTLERAKKDLRVKSKRKGFGEGGVSFWSLP